MTNCLNYAHFLKGECDCDVIAQLEADAGTATTDLVTETEADFAFWSAVAGLPGNPLN